MPSSSRGRRSSNFHAKKSPSSTKAKWISSSPRSKKTKSSKLKSTSNPPTLEEYLNKRDYVGASTFLDFQSSRSGATTSSVVQHLLWKGYCAFHNDELDKAQDIYMNLLDGDYGAGGKGNDGSEEQAISTVPKETALYLACAYIKNQMYDEAMDAAEEGPECPLKNRIIHLLLHKWNANGGQRDGEGGDDREADDDKSSLLVKYRQKLRDSAEDQLARAAVLFDQGAYQDAIDIYKGLLMENNKDRVALNVYIALCYFKMDYYDISNEVLGTYEQVHNHDSIFVMNLKACNHFRLYNGDAALDVFQEHEGWNNNKRKTNNSNHSHDLDHFFMSKHDAVRHNMVVFTDGQRAMQYLPPLVDSIPEARLNLVLYHLKNPDGLTLDEAEMILEEYMPEEPTTPQECIIKGIILATVGQKVQQMPHSGDKRKRILNEAQSYFHTVGSSPTETDTIPGRQCMASYLFLKHEFSEANVYLSSIKSYMADDDDFLWNYGMSLAASGDYVTAEDTLHQVQNQVYRSDPCYISWLARCQIRNGKANAAWKLRSSIDVDNSAATSAMYSEMTKEEDDDFLLMMANECFREKHFLVAARAFDALLCKSDTTKKKIMTMMKDEDDNSDLRVGLKISCTGVFRSVVIASSKTQRGRGRASHQQQPNHHDLTEVLGIIEHHPKHKGLEVLANTIRKWIKQHLGHVRPGILP